MAGDELLFADEGAANPQLKGDGGTWKIMIVDDHEEVHAVTRMVLDDFTFEGREVDCLSAYSGREAETMIVEHPDVAVMLLDVVMETDRAGLDVAHYVRNEAKNQFVRIILRTGQPGEAPEQEVVSELDINDYRQKTELTAGRLLTAVTTAIRSYRDLKIINESRRGLHLLAMSVAHQVRNRTIAIAGFANLVKRKAPDSPEVREHIETILQESTRLEGMVGDVTRYASIEIGTMRPSNIREMLEEAMEQVDAERADNGDSVDWDVFCPDQMVMVDPDLFIQAFGALLQNGVDFSGEHPKVQVSVSPGRLTCAIEIRDFGCGIRAEDMPHIFDPFFSLKPNGSGMGLSVVRRIVMEHQWDIFVDSVPDEGTVVRVVIPRRELTGVSG